MLMTYINIDAAGITNFISISLIVQDNCVDRLLRRPQAFILPVGVPVVGHYRLGITDLPQLDQVGT